MLDPCDNFELLDPRVLLNHIQLGAVAKNACNILQSPGDHTLMRGRRPSPVVVGEALHAPRLTAIRSECQVPL